MNSTLIDISDKFPEGLTQLYKQINEVSQSLEISYLVIGAMARDLVMVHGFDCKIERGTRDVDFGIQVQSWAQFQHLKEELIKANFEPNKDKPHQLTMLDNKGLEWEVDIIPFGEIANAQDEIAWPPKEDIVMSVKGFREALNNALDVIINAEPEVKIKVASPAGVLILKLISWLDRTYDKRRKDATDIYYMVKTYSKIPEILDELYDNSYMEDAEYDEIVASTMKLSDDALSIMSKESFSHIQENLFSDEKKKHQLASEIARTTHTTYDESKNLIQIIEQAFEKHTFKEKA
ncbi:nucleotidyl transferase AbiEii/AbiGii toxin family protein [Kangiella sp.]|uniref:nucleotidyl transferase AbiEii/AbiGii toxin family protein n=1 Tax=Kangiella sp. TaxID=1920245 RepID=UPI003A8FF5B0